MKEETVVYQPSSSDILKIAKKLFPQAGSSTYTLDKLVCVCRCGLESICLATTSVSTLATRSLSVVDWSSSLKPSKLFRLWTRLKCLACTLMQISRESVSRSYSRLSKQDRLIYFSNLTVKRVFAAR